MNITGKTKLLGIIGHPVDHSLSPLMHNAAIAALGLDFAYVPFPVEPDNLPAAVQGLRALGIRGFNVTIPHKSAVIPLLDRISPEAELCGAVNTVSREEGFLVGYNTDGIGLVKSLKEELDFDPAGKAVLMLGAGGAARGAVASLCLAGVSRIVIANRTRERAEALLDNFRHIFSGVDFTVSSPEMVSMRDNLPATDLLLNTTSVGMQGTSFAGLDLSSMGSGAVVYDMVYAPPETPLLAAARFRGLACANGLGMLAAQGEAAFAVWTGREAPAGLMKKELASVLAEIK